MSIAKFLHRLTLRQHSQQGQGNVDPGSRFEDASRKYDIVVHIGAPKTGSSALQNFLLRNKEQLRENGYVYPEHGLDKNGISGGHSALAIALIEKRLEDAERIFDAWHRHARNLQRTLLLSSEAFFNLPKQMEALFTGKRVLVFAYYRPPVDYVVSVHNQLVKRHYQTSTLKQYVSRMLSMPAGAANLVNKPWSEVLSDWQKVVGEGNLVVRAYDEEAFYKSQIERDFVHRLGMCGDNLAYNARRINSSYSALALEVKRWVNHVLDKENPLNHRIDIRLQEYSDARAEGGAVLLDEEIRQRLQDHFESTEKLIEERYLENPVLGAGRRSRKHRSEASVVSCTEVFDYLLRDRDVRAYLVNRTLAKLEAGNINYAILRLAEALGIENLEDVEQEDHWFSPVQLQAMSKYREADFLREIARISMQRGDLGSASALISRALELRPKGPGIIKLKNQIDTLVKNECNPNEKAD